MSFYNSNQSLVYGAFRSEHLQQQQPEGSSNDGTASGNSGGVVTATSGQHQQRSAESNSEQSKSEVIIKRPRQNKPGQKFGAKKKSWVWVWFVQDSNNPNIAACDYCGKIIIRLASDKGSPKKLSEHLKVHKLDRHSINYSRNVPKDGFGVTYNHNGQVVSYPDDYEPPVSHRPSDAQQQQAQSQSQPQQASVQSQAQAQAQAQAQLASQDVLVEPDTRTLKKQKTSNDVTNPFEIGTSSRYLCADFDNSPYSSMKFHKHLLKFLTENKLPISVIKSQSFQQLVYDLRSNSIEDLLELTGLYNSLIEVSGYGARESNENENHAVSALTNVVSRVTPK